MVAVLAALASALCFALAATLQQREAGRTHTSGVADPRLLWRLAHRPLWLAGIGCDGASAALHILALSLGSIALVQPVGVTCLVFAIPMVAWQRRQRVRKRDVLAAAAVLAGLAVLLSLLPTAVDARVAGPLPILLVVAVTLAVAAVATAIAHVAPGRPRALLLAAGAGTCFAIVAVLLRALLLLIGHPHGSGPAVAAAIGIVLTVPTGYLLLQNAYRAGHFAASLATAVVVDPLVAILAGIPLLGESLDLDPWRSVVLVGCGLAIVAGIALLVTSPAHLFEVERSASEGPGPVSMPDVRHLDPGPIRPGPIRDQIPSPQAPGTQEAGPSALS